MGGRETGRQGGREARRQEGRQRGSKGTVSEKERESEKEVIVINWKVRALGKKERGKRVKVGRGRQGERKE